LKNTKKRETNEAKNSQRAHGWSGIVIIFMVMTFTTHHRECISHHLFPLLVPLFYGCNHKFHNFFSLPLARISTVFNELGKYAATEEWEEGRRGNQRDEIERTMRREAVGEMKSSDPDGAQAHGSIHKRPVLMGSKDQPPRG
jgi:hypothetical protein